jgi:2-polyprenylphenol 6-hydroxylase
MTSVDDIKGASISDRLDVLIVGGGPVGGAVAALLAQAVRGDRSPMRIAVLEPRRALLLDPGAPMELRVSAYSRASELILRTADAWQVIAAQRVSPYERMRVWHESVAPTASDALVFDAADVGEPNLGYIVESRIVQHALLEAAERAGVSILSAGLTALHIEEDYVHVETTNGSLQAKLVVGADGAQSAVRAAVGLTVETSGYQQVAIVANVATARSHESTAWQRFLRTGTLAFLPLSDGTSSIVWSADDDVATTLLAATPQDFSKALDAASDFALGETRLVSERASFPLHRLAAHHYVAHRCALVGDAAHVVHPLAGQGVNLGLLDAAALAELLAGARREGEDPGALRVLRRYERWRKTETRMMSMAIDAFDRMLAHGTGPVSRLAQKGLGWVNRSPELKRMFIRRALGVAGELPAAARPPLQRGG